MRLPTPIVRIVKHGCCASGSNPLPSRLPRRDNQMTEIRMRRALGRSWGRHVVCRCGMRWPGTGRVWAVRPTARLVLRDRVCHGPTMSVWSCRGAGPCGVSGLPRLSPGMGTSGPGCALLAARRSPPKPIPMCRAVYEPCARGGGTLCCNILSAGGRDVRYSDVAISGPYLTISDYICLYLAISCHISHIRHIRTFEHNITHPRRGCRRCAPPADRWALACGADVWAARGPG